MKTLAKLKLVKFIALLSIFLTQLSNIERFSYKYISNWSLNVMIFDIP